VWQIKEKPQKSGKGMPGNLSYSMDDRTSGIEEAEVNGEDRKKL